MVVTKSVVVCDRSGFPIAVVRTSQKGFKKSTERGRLWIVDESTGRLLPMPGDEPLLAIVERDDFYLAKVDVNAGPTGESGTDGAGNRYKPGPGAPDISSPTDVPHLDLLQQLQAVIAQRQAAMPEGSYTTHLFREGLDKIRKKTGEEAVELILARTSEEIVSESADLIYHLMVLLQASGLQIDAVLNHLAGRMK